MADTRNATERQANDSMAVADLIDTVGPAAISQENVLTIRVLREAHVYMQKKDMESLEKMISIVAQACLDLASRTEITSTSFTAFWACKEDFSNEHAVLLSKELEESHPYLPAFEPMFLINIHGVLATSPGLCVSSRYFVLFLVLVKDKLKPNMSHETRSEVIVRALVKINIIDSLMPSDIGHGSLLGDAMASMLVWYALLKEWHSDQEGINYSVRTLAGGFTGTSSVLKAAEVLLGYSDVASQRLALKLFASAMWVDLAAEGREKYSLYPALALLSHTIEKYKLN